VGANRTEPLLPVRKPHLLGCHNPRVADRDAMNAILFLLRTGCQWNALDATGIPLALSIDGANRHDMKLVRGGCPEFCINGISLLLRHPVFELDSKPV
jgi:hypothetical protein